MPILVIQICKSWMHVDEYNNVYHERVMIALESKIASYFTFLQLYWTEEAAHVDIHVVLHWSLLKREKMMINSLNKSHIKITGNSCL